MTRGAGSCSPGRFALLCRPRSSRPGGSAAARQTAATSWPVPSCATRARCRAGSPSTTASCTTWARKAAAPRRSIRRSSGTKRWSRARVVDGPRICGGRPLAPVRVSVMRELTPACNTVLPAEAGFTPAPSPIAPTPKFPDSTREFVVPYDFDSDYLTLHTTRIIVEAARVAKADRMPRASTSTAIAAPRSSRTGQTLIERARIAEVRATKMGRTSSASACPADRIHVTWQREPTRPDGVTDPGAPARDDHAERADAILTTLPGHSSRRDSRTAAACDRACLTGFADAVPEGAGRARPVLAAAGAERAGSPRTASPLSIGDGLWKTGHEAGDAPRGVRGSREWPGRALGRARRRRRAGPPFGAAEGPDRRIHEIETVVARKGSHALFSPADLPRCRPSTSRRSQPGQRTPRDRMVAIADGYFEGIARHDSRW